MAAPCLACMLALTDPSATPCNSTSAILRGGAGLEQLLDQLAQQHQPAADPANRAVVEALPKLEVAPLVGEFQSLCTFP